MSRIHQWATNDRVSEFLREEFGINHVPCYYWLLCLLKMVKMESINQCFANWVYSFIPEKAEALTIALDGKTICSTGMDSYSKPLHNLNIFRKAAINLIKLFKGRTGSKQAISKIMLDCLLDNRNIFRVVGEILFTWERRERG